LKLNDVQLVMKLVSLYVTDSLLCPKESTSRPIPEPCYSNLHIHIQFLQNHFSYYFRKSGFSYSSCQT